MAVRDIVIWPDPVLKTRSTEVEAVGPDLWPLLDDMVETMYASDGVGLAAPQIGVGLRIFCVDTSGRGREDGGGADVDGGGAAEDDGGETAEDDGGETAERGPGLLFFINPEILEADGSTIFEEACLSLPDLVVDVERHTRVRMRALDRDGKPFEIEAHDFFAIALQHELDHLEGRLIVDRLSSLKRGLVRKKMLKIKQERAGEGASAG